MWRMKKINLVIKKVNVSKTVMFRKKGRQLTRHIAAKRAVEMERFGLGSR